jgi:4-hydroxythreonine-4-phosphate dehydrogenase
MAKPRLAITMGDPAGIGPEVIARIWSNPAVHEFGLLTVVGHPQVMRRACERFNPSVSVAEMGQLGGFQGTARTMPCLRTGNEDAALVEPGRVSAAGGQAAYDALVAATRLALAGELDGIVTAPLNKAALWEAGHHYPGHTELLAELCGRREVAMMLYLSPDGSVRGRVGLGVVHVTLHMALRDVARTLAAESILWTTRLADRAGRNLLQAAGIDGAPRIGVCALNPHAGEQGLFGDEEVRLIQPAVQRGREEGMTLTGPLPADTLLMRAAEGEFDVVVAMYHDQGHIALKLLGMHRAVNVTLGLPIVRTSVAHGTAFDLAWQGVAQTTGMIEALSTAAKLVNLRKQTGEFAHGGEDMDSD